MILRDASDLTKCEVFTEHKFETSVARFSPSGAYVCSGGSFDFFHYFYYNLNKISNYQKSRCKGKYYYLGDRGETCNKKTI